MTYRIISKCSPKFTAWVSSPLLNTSLAIYKLSINYLLSIIQYRNCIINIINIKNLIKYIVLTFHYEFQGREPSSFSCRNYKY